MMRSSTDEIRAMATHIIEGRLGMLGAIVAAVERYPEVVAAVAGARDRSDARAVVGTFSASRRCPPAWSWNFAGRTFTLNRVRRSRRSTTTWPRSWRGANQTVPPRADLPACAEYTPKFAALDADARDQCRSGAMIDGHGGSP
jgi:hypothetical protein